MLILSKNQSSTSVRATATVFEDPRSLELLARIERVAPSDAPVLITGETGTGKELVARELHARSRRGDRAFVAVNAGALSEHLIESELFGHERGAFTGAHQAQVGWFEAADGGTLFLDEIGDLPLSLQVKLLRVLSTGEVTRLGSRTPTPVDVRLIAATNVDLLAAMRARLFREDLYYRLSVSSLVVPPLRDRPGDILPLAEHFLRLYDARLGRRGVRLGAGANEWLLAYHWPGNIRELENAIHHGLLVCSGSELGRSDLNGGTAREPPVSDVPATPALPASSALLASGPIPPSPSASAPVVIDPEAAAFVRLEAALRELLPLGLPDLHGRLEGAVLGAAFRYSGHNQLETARLLGLSRHVVRARLIEHGQLPGPLRRNGRAGSAAPSSAARPGVRVLRIGYQQLGLSMLVKAYGALDAAFGARGVNIHWREHAGGIQIVEGLRRGELDVGVVGDCPAVFAQSESVPVVYVAAEPLSARGAAVLVPSHSTAQTMRDLRGKRVAVNRAAQAHYLLMLALEEAGVPGADVEICFLTPERARRAFQDGEVDAWAIWDPWLSSARLDLGARILRDTTGLFDSTVYYLARRELAKSRPDLIVELCNQLSVAARWVESDPVRAAGLVARDLGFSPDALVASLDRELGQIAITPEHLAAQQRIADQCVRLRLISRPVSVADAQWSDALAS